jgi:hypothetical protein
MAEVSKRFAVSLTQGGSLCAAIKTVLAAINVKSNVFGFSSEPRKSYHHGKLIF